MDHSPPASLPPLPVPDRFEASSDQASREVRFGRRLRLPLILFLLTAVSTFIAGATGWIPHELLFGDPITLRRTILANWQNGVIYSICLISLLFAHEMGHFLATVYYRVPASLPFFIPLPVTPIGTLGAVIGMDHRRADRKEMFDIGIAGPLAGLVIIVPVLIYGICTLDFKHPPDGSLDFTLPWGARLLVERFAPSGFERQTIVNVSQANPFFMAGWVGLLVTALNMLPVSQLDGGHVTYTLFGRGAHWLARAFMIAAVAYMTYSGDYSLSLMAGLIILIGVDHPPTSDDTVPIGPFRYCLGLVSLGIPVLCLSPNAIVQHIVGY